MTEVGSRALDRVSFIHPRLDRLDLLGLGLRPVFENVIALCNVVVLAVLVADGADGDGLDERTASQEVKNLPDRLDGPEEVAGIGLAAVEERSLRGTVVRELEERDVAQLVVRQICKDSIREMEITAHQLASRSNCRSIRL